VGTGLARVDAWLLDKHWPLDDGREGPDLHRAPRRSSLRRVIARPLALRCGPKVRVVVSVYILFWFNRTSRVRELIEAQEALVRGKKAPQQGVISRLF
jgi:hypothetical protein